MLLVSLLLLLLAAVGGLYAVLPRPHTMAHGVTVAGVDVSGMTRVEAQAAIAAKAEEWLGHRITLSAASVRREVTLQELGVRVDVERLVAEAYAIGRRHAFHRRVLDAVEARVHGQAIPSAFTLDAPTAQAVIRAVGDSINVPPRDARAEWDEAAGQVVITPDQQGGKLNEPASMALVRTDVLDALGRGIAAPDELSLPYWPKVPTITAAMLEPIDTVLGEYTTSFATSSRNRASNVETAARTIDGTLLAPGDIFSFNTVVGPRDLENGFKQAPVIVNGQLQPGIGGGICQVSSTMYNAVLLANLQIVERSHHSLPVSYVPSGRDATVAYGAIDFRCKNSLESPVVIDTAVSGRRMTVRILGHGPAPKVRILRSGIGTLPGRTVTKKDPSLPTGTQQVEKKGKPGIAVTVTRVVGEGPDAVSQFISRDKYLGEPTIVRVGTGEAVAGGLDTPAPEGEDAAPDTATIAE